jgi:hypothetical protein
MLTIPDCGVPVIPWLPLVLVPHATENNGIAAAITPKNIRDTLEFIFVSCEDVPSPLDLGSSAEFELGPDDQPQIPAGTSSNTQNRIELRRIKNVQ